MVSCGSIVIVITSSLIPVERPRMKVVAIIAQKGGAGRTTLAVHLATAASKAGYATVIIDLDPHASAASWGHKRRMKDGMEIIRGHTTELDGLIETARA